MRLFGDENLEKEVIEVLRRHGHDISTLSPGETGVGVFTVIEATATRRRPFLSLLNKGRAE